MTPGYAKALFRRALIHMELERYADALRDFQAVARVAPQFTGLAEWLPRAHRWAARPPTKNYYALLGIDFDATPAEIKKAYKAAALKWHPDKNQDNRERAEQRFKDILEAFEVLSDPRRRMEYGGGGDGSGGAGQPHSSQASWRSGGFAGGSFPERGFPGRGPSRGGPFFSARSGAKGFGQGGGTWKGSSNGFPGGGGSNGAYCR